MGLPGEREQVAEVLEKSTRLYDTLLQTTALGLLVMAKYDRAESQFGQTYDASQLAACDRFTAAEINGFREQAGITLSQFASYLSIPRADRGWSGWAVPIAQGFVSAFLYSVFLILVAILAKLGGHDLLDILRDALKP